MANFIIGLDFGTSQTKVCLYNTDTDIREFVKFSNQSYFLPSLITKKADKTFSYGIEDDKGIQYRYFKMSAAEDDDLIQITNEDLQGNLVGEINDYRKYSADSDIKPEILVLLYLSYIYLYVKSIKDTNKKPKIEGKLGALTSKKTSKEHTFSISLGIPTEWHNPDHFKRKVKFESLLISAVKLANQFHTLNDFINSKEDELLQRIVEINANHLKEFEGQSDATSSEIIKEWLNEYNLSVFPESAAGVNYLLNAGAFQTNFEGVENSNNQGNIRYAATLDIGAGTTDVAVFELESCKTKLREYICSESIEIASNDFYRHYHFMLNGTQCNNFESIKETENVIRENSNINDEFYSKAVKSVRGAYNGKGIEFAIRKTLIRKYFIPVREKDPSKSSNMKRALHEAPIFVFGGGSLLDGFSENNYYFFPGSNSTANNAYYFNAQPISKIVQNVDIAEWEDVKEDINLLILALGLTYDTTSFPIRHTNLCLIEALNNDNNEKYFYYDLQDAAFK